MIIRYADHNDILQMAGLLGELFAIEDDFVIDTQKQIRGLQLLLETPDTIILVAEKNGCIVGMVSMQQFISTAMGGHVGLIEDMIITHDFRGEGIGKRLLTAMIEVSKSLGYTRITLAVDERNRTAIKFYNKFGFQTSNMGLMYKIQHNNNV